MDQREFYSRLNDRMRRYGASPLPAERCIVITASPSYLATYDGQVAALVATSLLSRLSPTVHIGFTDIAMHDRLPWARRSLVGHAIEGMKDANPFGDYRCATPGAEDYVFHLGPDGHQSVVHGSGWNAYFGAAPSSLEENCPENGVGAALAVVLAAAHLFRTRFEIAITPFVCNAWDWTDAPTSVSVSPQGAALGHVMTVGLGSVGSAANYFLTLATRNFKASLIDHDAIGVHNITRSPIFTDTHARKTMTKVEAVAAFMREAGVGDVWDDPAPLHKSLLWTQRETGTPDIVISAANEFNVRYHIEMGYPPLQIYATTGRNWQTTLMRHEPGAPACSLCVFPPDVIFAPTACATGGLVDPQVAGAADKADAALPFLSFAAGLMTAAEILKLARPGYRLSADRVMLGLKHDPLFASTPIPHRSGCLCESRHAGIHREAIAGSLYVPPTRIGVG